MQRYVLSGGRYPVLRSLAIIYVVGAAMVAFATVLTCGFILISARFAMTDRLIMCAAALGTGFFLTISALAIAEVLKLAIDVEHNTRMNASPTSTVVTVGAQGAEVAMVGGGSASDGRGNGREALGGRLGSLDEETAEAALFRGH